MVLLLAVSGAMFVPMFSWGAALGGDGRSADEAAIRKTVDAYYQGVISADRKLLERAWDVPSGHMKHIRQGKNADAVTVTPISTAIGWWTRVRPKQSSSEVLSADVVDGKMASVKFRFVFDKWDYTEFLTLLKLTGQWKIVDKTYVRTLVEK